MIRVPRAIALIPALAAASAAMAADLPRRTAPPADYYAPPPAFSWTGFYLGLNFGGGIGTFSGGSNQLFGNPSGVLGGATAGYNYSVAPNFVVGAEADIAASSLNGVNSLPFFGYSGGGKITMLTTVRGRVGYSMDRALFFVTGGLALASMNAYVSDWRTAPFFGSQSSLQAGYTLGAGMEYAITNNVSAKVDYLYTSTGSRDYFPYTVDWSRFGANFSTLRAGVNYHF